MDTKLLLDWLGLPPGPWPPSDHVLLGLPPGPATAEAVELRALEQMDKLRSHQLVEPDLVTEGMNQLARAMIALSDPTAAAPPRAKKAKKSKADAPPPADDLMMDLRLDKSDPGPVEAAEPILDAEVVAADAPKARPPRRPFLPPERPHADPLALDEVPYRPPEPPAPPPGVAYAADARRDGYRHLVRVRKLLRGLDALRPFFADPGEQLLTPVKIYGYVAAVGDVRHELARAGDWPAVHGEMLLTVVRNPLPLAVFRSLVGSQRRAVAADWARARAELLSDYETTRETLRATRPRRGRVAAEWGNLAEWMRDNPEWLPVTLFVAALCVALARGLFGFRG